MAIINTQIKGGGGVQPVGTLGINTNGVYDVSSYANADVQVPTTAPDYYVKLAKTGGLSAQLYIAHDNPMINMAGIRDITDYALARAYYSNNTLNNVDWSSVKSIFTYGCAECFYYSNIKTINLNSLTTIATYGLYGGFYGSTLQSISLPSLMY